jgi:quinolinate synthase
VDYADFAGSTAGMVRYVEAHREKRDFFVLTECGMLGDLERKFPDRKFMTPCTICPHMKKITLENVAESLENGTHEITVPEAVRLRAKKALDRMLELGG